MWRKTLKESNPLKIFIGWDSREDIAYQVAKQSIVDHASVPVEIIPLKLKTLTNDEMYWRDEDKLASTQFTFSRFLVPELTNFTGWALFIDCDFLFQDDVANLFAKADNKFAVMCAQHDYTPQNGIKMDGQTQTVYPRKNWSSMMLFNCSHPSNKKLTKELVNNETTTGQFLHRLSWLNDEEIGKLSHEWNWLVGWYKEPEDGTPKALHYTEGGPWFENYRSCDYATPWFKTHTRYYTLSIDRLHQKIAIQQRESVEISALSLTDDKKEILSSITKKMIDPSGKYYKDNSMENLSNKIPKVAAIFNDEILTETYKHHGLVYDEYLEAFVQGCDGIISEFESEIDSGIPLVIRGVGGSSRRAIKHCWDTGRDFYALDSGYWGNDKSKSKGWHRITKNALQNTGPIIDKPADRLGMIGYNYKKFTKGKKILICPPSDKVMMLFKQPTAEEWVTQTINELKKYTDRPIEVRLKPVRQERVSNKTMAQALADDVHCMVTYNSIAATEALMNGKPAIALGPNAAQVLCNTSLSEIENLNIPTKDEMYAFMKHLSYCQFSKKEMLNGVAWRIINESN